MSELAVNTGYPGASAGAEAASRGRPTLPLIAPPDQWARVRGVLMIAYGFGYVWFLRNVGLPIDRITVAITVGVFLFCAFLGKPLHVWLLLAFDIVCYVVMWWGYENTRGMADRLGMPLQGRWMRDADRWLFFGHDPNVVLQRWLATPAPRWYEYVFSVTYYTHFIVPMIFLALLWAFSHRQFAAFLRRFATLLAVACAMFVIWPTVPPWMAASSDPRYGQYKTLPTLRRDTWRGLQKLGFEFIVKSWDNARDWGNAVAAMPSLHASFALTVVLFSFRWVHNWWLRAVMLCFPALMLCSLVFFAEHWVVDGLAGWAVVGTSFTAWHFIERAVRHSRAQRARVALAG